MRKDAVVVTGISGFIGAALIEKLALHFMLGDLDRGGEHYMGTAKRSLPTANKGEGHEWTGYCHRQWRPDRPGHFGHRGQLITLFKDAHR
jgi:hypothetical protein